MTTYEMIRCKKCSCLVKDEKGGWICGECGENIHNIDDESCSAEQDW